MPFTRTAAAVTEEQNDAWNAAAKDARLVHLEAQAIQALLTAAETFEHVTFPCALIAGDVVILHLLNKAGLLKNGKVKVCRRTTRPVARAFAFDRIASIYLQATDLSPTCMTRCTL